MGKININLSNMKLQDIIKQLLVVVLISLYGCSDFLDPKIDDNYNDETVWSDRTFAMGALVVVMLNCRPIMIAFQTITLIVLLIML